MAASRGYSKFIIISAIISRKPAAHLSHEEFLSFVLITRARAIADRGNFSSARDRGSETRWRWIEFAQDQSRLAFVRRGGRGALIIGCRFAKLTTAPRLIGPALFTSR